MSGVGSNGKALQKWRNLRRGKKSVISRRINEIKAIIAENGSRTRAVSTLEVVLKVLENARSDNDQVLQLTDHAMDDVDWINDLEFAVDSVRVEIDEYLKSREGDDPSSAASRTREWVEQTAALDSVTVAESDVSLLTTTLQDMGPLGTAAASVPGSSTPFPNSTAFDPSIHPVVSLPSAFDTWRDSTAFSKRS